MIFPRTFDWNSAVRSWNPDPKLTKERAALVLFDVLEEYVHPKDPAKAAVMKERRVAERLTQLLNGAREAGLTVFYAAANHSPDGSDVVARLTDTDMDLRPWPDGAQPFRPTVHRGEAGAQIARELAPRPNEIVIYKHRWSAFYQTSLELNLRARGLDTIVLAGLSTDVGIASTAFSARDADFGIVFVRDACWAHRGPNHDFLMDRIFPRMGRVMTAEQAIALMK
jgi:ureidoacrylate peracid hydrolase